MRIKYWKFRYYLALLFSLFCLFLWTGCNEKEKGETPSPSPQLTALSAPTELKVFGDELSWSAVENASGYLVKINNDKDVTTNETRYALKLKETENLDIRVYAVGDGITWENSKAGTLQYKYEKPTAGLKYTKIEGGYEVAGTYEKAVGRVVIPDEYEGEPIIRIAEFGFGEFVFESGSGQMGRYWKYTSVRLPAGLKEIGADGFLNATSLTKIELPKSLEKIGSSAFYNTALTSVEIPSGIKEIPNGCYFGTPITELKLPEGLEKIGESAFQKCIKLLNVTFPSSLKEIEEWAFRESGLTSVSLPSTVERLGKEAFADTFWYKLQSDGWMILGDGFLYGYKGELAADTTVDCAALGIKNIAGGALEGQTNLKKIVFPNETTEIGAYAFQDCTGLTEVVFPASVKTVGSGAFKGCTGLTEVVLPASLTSVGSGAFSGCTGLTEMVLPASVKTFSSYAFQDCTGLKRVEIFADFEGTLVFLGCTELSEVVLHEGITKIAEDCFSGCSSLQEIEFPSTLESISNGAFQRTGLRSVILPFGVKQVGEEAFANCANLETVKMLGVEQIGDSIFYNCESLESVELQSVVEIGDSAFYGCGLLVEFRIPDTCKTIGGNTFYTCSNLISVTIGASVESIGDYAFSFCYKLVEVYDLSSHIVVEKGDNKKNGSVGAFAKDVYTTAEAVSKLSTDENGYIVYTDGENKILMGYTGTETALILPDGVTEIGEYAFNGNEQVVSVEISDSVKIIGKNAFYRCKNLTSVKLGARVEELAYGAFNGCEQLASIVIPTSLTKIGLNPFLSCKSVTSVYYAGTASEWAALTEAAGKNIEPILTATVYFYVEKEEDVPTDGGKYWRYVDGVPTAWEV